MAIALKPDNPVSYFNLGNVINQSGHHAEAAPRFLEAKERWPVGSESWARATAHAFNVLTLVAELAKPEWWNDEGLKALSARIVRAAPNDVAANSIRADVLSGQSRAWEVKPRSATELEEAAAHFDLAAALCAAPVQKSILAGNADWCRNQAEAMRFSTEVAAASPSKAGAAPLLLGIALALALAGAAVAVLVV